MTDKEKTKLQKEIIDSLPSYPSGRLLLSIRIGKTKVAIDLIKREKPESILWVTPSSELADKDIPSEFETWKAKRFIQKLTTVTWKSLPKMKGHYDIIILDEEQFITELNSKVLLDGTLTWKSLISMTGSATQRVEKNDIYKQLNLKVLYEVPLIEAVDMGLLANYKINVITVPMSNKTDMEMKFKTRTSFTTSERKNYEYLSRQVRGAMITNSKSLKFHILKRMRAIKNSPSKDKVAQYLMNNLKGRKLFFSATIDQAERLSQYTYHSKTDNKDLQKFLKGDINTIAMVNAGGTGFTYKNLDHLVLVQADSNKNGLTGQKIGRTLLKQKNYKATVWIICLSETKDADWVESTLRIFHEDKIEYISFSNLKESNYVKRR